jgi:hypothetical protein
MYFYRLELKGISKSGLENPVPENCISKCPPARRLHNAPPPGAGTRGTGYSAGKPLFANNNGM